jgi:hypothetical protein
MTDTTQPFTPPTAPTRQALEAVNRSYPGKVTGRLRAALLDMVWKGSRRDDAAKANSMSIHGLREALRKPHVKAFYLAELGVLRESERPKTFHRLCDLRDQDENKNAAVAAAKVLEQISDNEQTSKPNMPSPGVTIRILNVAPQPVQSIEAKVIDAGE